MKGHKIGGHSGRQKYNDKKQIIRQRNVTERQMDSAERQTSHTKKIDRQHEGADRKYNLTDR